MSNNYDAIIIGAGIGGLTCGNILAKNGLKVLILEKNYCPGGAVTTFYRDKYPVDISHCLCAVKEGGVVRKILEYLGIYRDLEFIELEKTFAYIPDRKKEPIYCYSNLDKYKAELKKYFSDESENIDKLFDKMEHIWKNEVLKSYYAPSLPRLLTYPFVFPNLFRYRNYTFEQFLSRFIKNSALKEVVSAGWPYLGLDRFSVSALYMVCMIMAYHKEGSFSVKGGFGKISETLTSNLKKLGGEINCNINVCEVLINNKKAYGVKDKNNNIYYGNKIISNIDTKRTFQDLLKNQNLSKRKTKKIDRIKKSCSALQVNLVVQGELNKNLFSTGTVMYPSTVAIERKMRKILKTKKSQGQSPIVLLGINPLEDFLRQGEENTYVINILYLPVAYTSWKELADSHSKEEYKRIKDELVDLAIAEMKKYFSIEKILSKNIFTPFSFERWLNATEGAIYDAAASPSQMLLNRMKHSTPLSGFYLVGTKTFPGAGIAGAFCSAVGLSDIILKGSLTRGKFTLKAC